MFEERRPVLLEQPSGFLEPAPQLVLGLRGHRHVDAVDGNANREHGERGACHEDAVGERREQLHRRPIVTFSSTSPPDSGTVIRRDSSGVVSFQTITLYVPGGTLSSR